MQVFLETRTKSGLKFNSLNLCFKLYLHPERNIALLRRISGRVSFPLILDMILLLTSLLNLSGISRGKQKVYIRFMFDRICSHDQFKKEVLQCTRTLP